MFVENPISPERLYLDEELCGLFRIVPQYELQPYWQDKIFLVRLILGTGLRVSEVLRVRVPEDVSRQGIIYVRRGAKSGRPRPVKCSPELEPYFLGRIKTSAGPHLFPGITSTRTLELWWKEVFDLAGVEHRPGRSCHAGRHQYATEELNSGRLKPWQVQAQLGHKSINMTLGQYTHCLMERMYQEHKEPKWWALAAMLVQALHIVKSA